MSEDNIQLVNSSVPLLRRRQVVAYYQERRISLGLAPKVNQLWENRTYPDIQNVLFSEFRDDVGEYGRFFHLWNAQKGNYENVTHFDIHPDDSFSLGGGLTSTGWDYEIPYLRAYSSWHSECIVKSFEIYKLWMIDLVPEDEIDQRIQEFTIERPLNVD